MNVTLRVRWSIAVKIITLLVVIVISYAEYALIVNGKIFLPIVITVVSLLVVACTPISVTLNHSEFVLKKIIGKIHIPYHQIETIEPFVFTNNIRLFGSGGFCGYIGFFFNDEKGRYYAYIGNVKQSFYIATKSKKYAFSCENTPFVIETIKNHIQHGTI